MKRKLLFPLILLLFCLASTDLSAQNVGISGTSIVPDASSLLEVRAPDKGILIPRVALTGVADMVTVPLPANSLLVFNTGTGGLTPAGYYYNAGTPAAPNWRRLATAGEDWSLTGNSGTVAGTNFIGTIDAVDWVVKTSNLERMRVLSSGNVGIAVTAPTRKLEVDGLGTTTAIYGQYDADRYTYLASPIYGVYSNMNTGANLGYGGYFYNTNSASACYGTYAGANYTGAGNASYTYGSYVSSSSTTQDQYGIYNYASHTGTGGFLYGIRNYTTMAAGNATTQYGMYNYSTRGADDALNYGIYSYVNNGTTTYGIYSNAVGGTTNWAGYFNGGNVYIANNCGIGSLTPNQKLTVNGTVGIQEGGVGPAFYTILRGGDQTADINYTLPPAQGATGTVLRNDGTGVLSWEAIGGGTKILDINLVNATTYTLSGLDGDNDIGYRVILMGNHPNTNASQKYGWIAINGDVVAANYSYGLDAYWNYSGLGYSWDYDAYNIGGILLYASWAADNPNYVCVDAVLSSFSGTRRHAVVQYSLGRGNSRYITDNLLAGVWTNTVTNITSLVFGFSANSGFTGRLIVYKFQQ